MNRDIDLQINNVDFWSANELCKGGMRIYWSSNIGCGTLDIIKTSGNDGDDLNNPYEQLTLIADTEYMDSQDDKRFTKKILELLAEKLQIIG